MNALQDIERNVSAKSDELNRRLGIAPAQPSPQGHPVGMETGRAVPSGASSGMKGGSASPLARLGSWVRLALGGLAACVLFFFFPFHFQYALIGVGICLFQSVVYELLFSCVARKRPDGIVGENRCVNCRRWRWLRGMMLFACCEAIPMSLVWLLVLFVFN